VAAVGPADCIISVAGGSAALSLDGEQGCVVLDGTGSSDPDGDALSFAWTVAEIPITLTPDQEPGGGGSGSGSGTVTLSGNTLTVNLTFSGLEANTTAAHIHGPAGIGTNAAVLYPLTLVPAGSTAGAINQVVTLANGTGGFTIAQQLQQLRDGLWYINIHSTAHPGGTIRGQLLPTTASGALADLCLPVGCHEVVLQVSDGQNTSSCSINVCVVTAGDAVEQCIALVDDADLGRKNKRPLIASLKAAQASFDRGDLGAGTNQLGAFLNKVRAQVAKDHPAEAEAFSDCAQDIIDAIDCAAAR
jgi:hypothetical protein